jgi:hypothetical protein
VSGFLPEGYKPPEKSARYMKWQQGENRFRVLSQSPLIGNEGWKDKKPIRKPVGASWQLGECDEDKKTGALKLSHFWALAVWDYATHSIRVLEITQSSIQKAINTLSKDKDYGHPSNYDIVVTRSGSTMEDTEYSIMPKPPKAMHVDIVAAWDAIQARFDLSRLWVNGDPFGEEMAAESETSTGFGGDNASAPADDDIPF